MASVFVGVFSTVFTLGTYSLEELKSSGQFGIQYHHLLGERFMLGCYTGYEYLSLVLKDKNGTIRQDDLGSHYLSLLPSVKFYYFNNPHFSAYAKFQVGGTFALSRDIVEDEIKDSFDIKPMFALQAVPFGMEFGGESIRGYIEAAYGSQGLVAIGIRKSF